MSADADAPLAQWESVLDRLESDVVAYAAVLADGAVAPPARWEPPSDLGPVPARLRDRAEQLLASLHELESRTAPRAAEVRRHRDLTSRMSALAHRPAVPAYLDLDA